MSAETWARLVHAAAALAVAWAELDAAIAAHGASRPAAPTFTIEADGWIRWPGEGPIPAGWEIRHDGAARYVRPQA